MLLQRSWVYPYIRQVCVHCRDVVGVFYSLVGICFIELFMLMSSFKKCNNKLSILLKQEYTQRLKIFERRYSYWSTFSVTKIGSSWTLWVLPDKSQLPNPLYISSRSIISFHFEKRLRQIEFCISEVQLFKLFITISKKVSLKCCFSFLVFNGISTFVDYLMLKPSLKSSSDTIQVLAGGMREFNTFSRGISPKVSVIAWLEFDLAYFKSSTLATTPRRLPSNGLYDNRNYLYVHRGFLVIHATDVLFYLYIKHSIYRMSTREVYIYPIPPLQARCKSRSMVAGDFPEYVFT